MLRSGGLKRQRSQTQSRFVTGPISALDVGPFLTERRLVNSAAPNCANSTWQWNETVPGKALNASETADPGNAQLLLTPACRWWNDALALHQARAAVIRNSQTQQEVSSVVKYHREHQQHRQKYRRLHVNTSDWKVEPNAFTFWF